MPISIDTCPICHKQIPLKTMVIVDIEEYDIVLCPSCYGFIGNCASCEYVKVCNFENDHSEPQMVQQQLWQGMSIITMPVKNPHLVEKHCKSCRCSYENMCQRENDNGLHCGRYKIMSEILNLGVKR